MKLGMRCIVPGRAAFGADMGACGLKRKAAE